MLQQLMKLNIFELENLKIQYFVIGTLNNSTLKYNVHI